MPVGPCILNQVSNREFEKSLTPEERATFWSYAKSLGANTGESHANVISKMAQTFNMPERLVSQALDGPKSLRKASDEVRARQRNSAQFMAANRRHLAQLDKTGAAKLMNFLFDGTRSSLLFAHGPVPPVTHAIDIAPTNPIKFVQQYIRGFKALSPAAHEKIMAELPTRQFYKVAMDAGLPIGPEPTEGFHKSGWAGRAMDAALKPLRYELFEGSWEKTPEALRTPEMAKLYAQQYGHATMALVKGEKMEVMTRGIRKNLLAPQMTPAKFAKSILDPIETLSTFERMAESKFNKNVRPPTPEERRIAMNRVQRSARYLGTTFSALAVNEAILRSTGSNQHVNYSDPTKSDFLAFKFAGRTWRMRGTVEIIALVAKLATLGRQKKKFGQQTPEDALMRYSEYKLTPGIGLGKEVLTGKDVFGRPTPWSKEEGSSKFPRKNYMEFVGEHGPIFVGHAVSAFHEALRDQGVDTRQSMNVIRAITRNPQATIKATEEALIAGVPEFFGVNVQPDRSLKH